MFGRVLIMGVSINGDIRHDGRAWERGDGLREAIGGMGENFSGACKARPVASTLGQPRQPVPHRNQRGKPMMKTIGLIGGMSWESTVPYYRLINEAMKERLGGLHSARIVLYSVDFHEIEQLQRSGDWATAGQALADAARRLQAAGADVLLICANTMHKVAEAVEQAVDIPLLHVVDSTARTIRAAGVRNVGLLGTRFTMEQAFYTDRLREHGLQVIVPNQRDRDFVHRSIYEELCLGQFLDASREAYRRVIGELAQQGAEAVILGCTEIALLVKPEHAALPLFDTTRIHALAAVDYALGSIEEGERGSH
jgi:aspartate racemase